MGGLDYAAKEEDVRVFFEELVKAERGANKEGSGKWVTGVRIVRDKETQLGKGFGYVHFAVSMTFFFGGGGRQKKSIFSDIE